MTEADLMRSIQLAATAEGARLFRNNVGILPDARGVPVKFGLVVGSADLIGWTPRAGRAVFTAIEVKVGNRKPTAKQIAFLEAVVNAGGIAGIARSVDDALALIRG